MTAVEICVECDIADCHHIRARRMTTAPVGCLDEREAFEAWAWKHLKQDARSWKHPSGEYVYLQSEWNAFQAGRASVSAGRQEGWQLVPVEPTVAMAQAAYARRSGLFAKDVHTVNAPMAIYRDMLAAAPHQAQEAQGDRHG